MFVTHLTYEYKQSLYRHQRINKQKFSRTQTSNTEGKKAIIHRDPN